MVSPPAGSEEHTTRRVKYLYEMKDKERFF